jgi:hypothetical protein
MRAKLHVFKPIAPSPASAWHDLAGEPDDNSLSFLTITEIADQLG